MFIMFIIIMINNVYNLIFVHRSEQPGVPGLHLGRRLRVLGHRDQREEGGRGQDHARGPRHRLPRHLRRLHVHQVR